MIQKLIILLLIVLTNSCEKVKDEDNTIWVYKTKKDYSKNVAVELSVDKNKITSAPGNINTRWPILLIDDYYLNGSFGVNTGYLSLSVEEYNKYSIKPGVDSLFKLIIEKDPFTEFYQRIDDNSTFRDENGAFGIDTVLLNTLIRANDLEKYFDRLK